MTSCLAISIVPSQRTSLMWKWEYEACMVFTTFIETASHTPLPVAPGAHLLNHSHHSRRKSMPIWRRKENQGPNYRWNFTFPKITTPIKRSKINNKRVNKKQCKRKVERHFVPTFAPAKEAMPTFPQPLAKVVMPIFPQLPAKIATPATIATIISSSTQLHAQKQKLCYLCAPNGKLCSFAAPHQIGWKKIGMEKDWKKERGERKTNRRERMQTREKMTVHGKTQNITCLALYMSAATVKMSQPRRKRNNRKRKRIT